MKKVLLIFGTLFIFTLSFAKPELEFTSEDLSYGIEMALRDRPCGFANRPVTKSSKICDGIRMALGTGACSNTVSPENDLSASICHGIRLAESQRDCSYANEPQTTTTSVCWGLRKAFSREDCYYVGEQTTLLREACAGFREALPLLRRYLR